MDSIVDAVRCYLACPQCHSKLSVDQSKVFCQSCDFVGQVLDGVVTTMDCSRYTYFDQPFEILQESKRNEKIWQLSHLQQAKILTPYLKPGVVVLDVGCGRNLQYQKPTGCFVIGLDPSFISIRANINVDLRVLGTAFALPVPSGSVDVIICFYSVHHIVGNSLNETRRNVCKAFEEFARVLKPAGDLFVFEVSPWLLGRIFQSVVWELAHRVLHTKLEMFLWSCKLLKDIGYKTMSKATLNCNTFRIPMPTLLPPFLAFPWLRVPRFLIPVDLVLYHWHL
jgi:ubiquinone/menaquinone biosynthesis C-methylase UbiE